MMLIRWIRHSLRSILCYQLLGETEVEEVCSPSNFENYVVSYDVFDPTTFNIGETQVEEACNLSNFENVGNQSLADCVTGADVVLSEDVDPTTFDIGEIQVVEACNQTNIEDMDNQSLADIRYCN
ncbi:hypothetical protein Pyn_16311 [Prunus yedoensis var. nudiflora]|uniref:Uncharacterized protein n=1 Tax=Prunus yedoensis var. nudiflora TaxID=2094558 RepID=A0A314ZH30_PRUYE|nr:hypothetical protein Pyn_16311 [Prunus yedoensis var. nudiflora]